MNSHPEILQKRFLIKIDIFEMNDLIILAWGLGCPLRFGIISGEKPVFDFLKPKTVFFDIFRIAFLWSSMNQISGRLVGWLFPILRVLIHAKPFWFMKIHKNSNKSIKQEQSWI